MIIIRIEQLGEVKVKHKHILLDFKYLEFNNLELMKRYSKFPDDRILDPSISDFTSFPILKKLIFCIWFRNLKWSDDEFQEVL